jgi:hypothetical protein
MVYDRDYLQGLMNIHTHLYHSAIFDFVMQNVSVVSAAYEPSMWLVDENSHYTFFI